MADVIKLNRAFTNDEMTPQVIKLNRPFTNDEMEVQSKQSLGKQLGQSFIEAGKSIVDLPYKLSAHALQGLEGQFRPDHKMSTYKNPITGTVVEPYTIKTPLGKPIGLGLQGAAFITGNPTLGGAMVGGGGAMESGEDFGNIVKSTALGALAGKTLGIMSGQPIISPKVSQVLKSPSKFISSIRDYPANKVNAIRQSFWNEYAPKEWQAYGQAIENLPNTKTPNVNGSLVIQNLQKQLSDRGLIDQNGNILKGFTTADNKLIKAYNNIERKWAEASNGELNINTIIDEYKNIRGKYTNKPTPTQRRDIEAANDLFSTVEDQINVSDFAKAKARYREFKGNQQVLHEAIDLYAPGMKTAKGERFLTKGPISETTQGRKTVGMIKEKTGQSLKGAKVITKINQVNPLNYIRGRR